MATITVRLSTSITSCTWRLSNGRTGSWSIQDGVSQSWTRYNTNDYLYITGFSIGSNYRHPVYFERDDGYQQQLTDASGNWVDNGIRFSADKSGVLVGTYVAPAATYTLSYNGNGATGGSTSSQTGASAYYVKSCGFTKTGYTFSHWTSGGYNYNPGDLIHLSSNKTLYAVWSANRYTVSYNANGGSGAPAAQTKYYGTTLILSTTKPTRSGYAFLGWAYTSSSTASVSYNPGDAYTINAGAVLYAVWGHSVSYNANGGSGAPATQYFRHGYSATLSSAKPTWSGYNFVGWSESSSRDTAQVYSPGATLTSITKNYILYAVWQCIVKFYNNGSLYSQGYPRIGGTLTMPTLSSTSAATFGGWTDDEGTHYNGGSVVTFMKSHTMTAVWIPITYTITYNGNNATGGSTAKQTGARTYTIRSCGFTKTGYNFRYWQTASGTKYYPGDSVTLNGNMTLYAYWEAIRYTVSYNANGGTNAPESQTKYYGIDMTLRSDKPTWNNHTFAGWSTSSDRHAEIEYTNGANYTKNESAVLYAVWWVVTSFYSKGSLYTEKYGRIGDKVILPTLSDTSTEKFKGWSQNGETFDGGAEITVNANSIFVAVWETISFNTITYNGNNATGGSTESQSGATTYIIRECGFYKTGYKFQYWRTASGTQYHPGDRVTPSGNMTLYAQWAARKYFYWHGSEAADATYFAVGQRIDAALTAEAWNRLCSFINDVRTEAGLSTISFSTVSPGDPISAVKFNIVSNAIKQIVNAGYGTMVPATVSTGTQIITSLFHGRGSLKAAINSCVDEL